MSKVSKVIVRGLAFLLVLGLLTVNLNCAQKGLVTEKYAPEFYQVPKLLSDAPLDQNPTFVVYGDNRPGWRVQERFLRKKNWLTWKMLIFPFYELYWLGNGVSGGINWLRRTPDYGGRERRMVRDAVYAEAQRSAVDFILNTGDIPYDGQRPSHWATYLRENKMDRPLLVDFPYLPAIGNHERANDPTYGLANYRAIFPYPRFYVVEFPDAALFVVDSNLIIDQYHFIDDERQDALFEKWFVSSNPEQPAWLERELAARDKTFKMVAMHHPPTSFGTHHSDWIKDAWGRKLQEKRRQLIQLFQEQGVQVVFCGHEHLYEHNVIQYNRDEDGRSGEMHLVITGGGGVPLRDGSNTQTVEKYQQNYRAEGIVCLLVKQEAAYHYCRVGVKPNQIEIKVFETTGDATQPSRLMDEITIQN